MNDIIQISIETGEKMLTIESIWNIFAGLFTLPEKRLPALKPAQIKKNKQKNSKRQIFLLWYNQN